MRPLAFCLFATTLLQAENWPQYRGPSANGLGNGVPPLRWNTETGENIRWKTPIPGLGYSSPIVWGDRIFLTTAVPAQGAPTPVKLGLYGDIKPVAGEGTQTFQILCLHRRTGKIIWQQTAVQTNPQIKRHPKSSHVNPTPATDGQRLIVSFGSEGLYAYSLDGKLLWKKDLGVLDSGYYVAPEAQWGFASSPVLHEGKVIIQADVQKNSFLAAFDAKTGNELWRTARQDVPTFGTPAVLPNGEGGLQVVVNGWKHMGGYDLATGTERWRLAGTGDIPVPTPLFANGLIVVTAAHGGGRPIYAIRPNAKGDLNQNKAAIVWTQERAGNYMQTPLLVDGIAYFCYDNGVLTAFELASGERLYQQRLGTAAGFTSSPVARRRPPLCHKRRWPHLRPPAGPGASRPGRKRTRRTRHGQPRPRRRHPLHPRRPPPLRHRPMRDDDVFMGARGACQITLPPAMRETIVDPLNFRPNFCNPATCRRHGRPTISPAPKSPRTKSPESATTSPASSSCAGPASALQ